jgi:hypothetical protein
MPICSEESPSWERSFYHVLGILSMRIYIYLSFFCSGSSMMSRIF